jgi:hypothetical protein
MPEIKLTIDSIFKGHNPAKYFSVQGGYDSSIGVDPDFPVGSGIKTSGMIIPTRFQKFSSTGITGAPLWILTNNKNSNIYVYDSNGKFVSYEKTLVTETALTSPTSGAGNGAEYYNNFLYLATPTNVARYGPLDGSPAIGQDVWTAATLGSQTALGNATYPAIRGIKIPNHPMKTHANNQLYIGDVINGRGVLHAIKTTKGAAEGDTNDGSQYNVLDFLSGWWPTDIESWGTWLAITAIQTTDADVNQGQSALFLWDTVDEVTYQKGPILLPDPLVTAVKNIGGILYIWSGNAQNGVRVSKYIGGEAVQEVAYMEEGVPPFAGAVDALGNRINWGGFTTYPGNSASVFAFGSKRSDLPAGLHNVAKSTSADANNQNVTALRYVQQSSNVKPKVIIGWNDDTSQGIDKLSATATYASIFRSEMFNIGKSFAINSIRIPFGVALAVGMELIVKIYTDDESVTTTLTTINSTNFQGRYVVFDNIEMAGSRGSNNFLIELNFGGTVELPVLLPIEINVSVQEED